MEAKIDTEVSIEFHVVRESKKVLHQLFEFDFKELRLKLLRWREILDVPYANHKIKLMSQ